VRAAPLLLGFLLLSATLVADDRTVLFDPDVDFSTFKTYVLFEGSINSKQPEITSQITLKKIADAVHAALAGKSLKATTDQPDLLIEYSLTTMDFAIGSFGRANPMGGRGRGRATSEAGQPDFSDATLVLDMKAGSNRELVWRGVYNDTEDSLGKLADALPRDAAALLSEYPPRKKK
jgi:uncharacterized protein DUF4136